MYKIVRNAVIIVMLSILSVAIGSAATAATNMIPVIIDGAPTQERAVLINGKPYLPLSILSGLQGKIVNYNAVKKQIDVFNETVAMISDEPSGVKPVLEIVMGEPEYKELVESLGLKHKTSLAIPEKLQFYSCLILNNPNAVTPKIADRLRKFVSEGGGVVLYGDMPQKLVGRDLSEIAGWFGCAQIYNTKSLSLRRGRPGFSGSLSFTLYSEARNPFGAPFGKGVMIFQYKGEGVEYTVLDEANEFCEIAARWRCDNPQTKETAIAAMMHTYGKGRVYWQSLANDPNYPKLGELLQAGIWRAATGKNLNSKE